MQLRTRVLSLAAASVAMLVVGSAKAAVVFTNSATAPTIGANDQYYHPGAVEEANTIGGSATDSAANDASTYVAFDRQSKGMSFTTGSNPLGYSLTSISVQHVNWPTFVTNGTWAQLNTNDTVDFRIGTISGSTLGGTDLLNTGNTPAVYTGTNLISNGNNGTGQWLTFASNVSGEALATLAANTTYYFEIASNRAWFELNSTAANGYAGGQAFSGTGNANGVLDADRSIALSNGDFAFHAALTVVPEPASIGLLGLAALGLVRRRSR